MKWQLVGNLAGKDGRNGADAKAVDAGAIAADVLSMVPMPRDGKDIDPLQVKAIVAAEVADVADSITNDILRRVREGLPVVKDGRDGKDVDPLLIKALIAAEVADAFSKIKAPKDGKDGKDIDPEVVMALVNREVADAVARIPVPKDGRDGLKGDKGDRGNDGDSPVIDVDQVVEALKSDSEAVAMLKGEPGSVGPPVNIEEVVTRAVALIPKPKDGENGRDGTSVTTEQIADVVRQRFDTWALEFEREAEARQRHAMGLVPLPRDGTDGRDGRDGFGLDDFEVQLTTPDGGRTLLLELSAGGRTSVSTLRTATPLDRGPFDATKRYVAGDGITYGGHWWIAQKDTPQGKPGESGDWRLAVRRGKDAKE